MVRKVTNDGPPDQVTVIRVDRKGRTSTETQPLPKEGARIKAGRPSDKSIEVQLPADRTGSNIVSRERG